MKTSIGVILYGFASIMQIFCEAMILKQYLMEGWPTSNIFFGLTIGMILVMILPITPISFSGDDIVQTVNWIMYAMCIILLPVTILNLEKLVRM